MNPLVVFQSPEAGQSTQAMMPDSMVSSRLKIAQEASSQTIERVRQALEKRFSGLVGENSALRRELTSSTLQNRELVLVQHRETSALQEQLEGTRAELAHVREEKRQAIANLQQQIDELRAELGRKDEVALLREQETAQTVAKLRQELQQVREETLQRMKVMQIEKEAVFQESENKILKRVAEARSEERVQANQEADGRIALLKTENKRILEESLDRARIEGSWYLARCLFPYMPLIRCGAPVTYKKIIETFGVPTLKDRIREPGTAL